MGGFDLGLILKYVKLLPEIEPLLPRIRAAVDTVERYMPQVQKISADPSVKDALDLIKEIAGILSKAQAK